MIYRKLLQAIALRRLYQEIDIPKPSLGVGQAELAEPIVLPFKLKPRYTGITEWEAPHKWKTVEAADHHGTGPAVKQSDFPHTGWQGEAI